MVDVLPFFLNHVLPIYHIEQNMDIFQPFLITKVVFCYFLHHPQAAPMPECQEAPGVPSGYLTELWKILENHHC